jgi:peptidyl-prolyl cis-trans isomerase A (cyclophilin A)
VRFETSQGPVVMTAHRDWAPIGADRFYFLVWNGFFDGERFFRVRAGFIAQFGLNGDPAVIAAWKGWQAGSDRSRRQRISDARFPKTRLHQAGHRDPTELI